MTQRRWMRDRRRTGHYRNRRYVRLQPYSSFGASMLAYQTAMQKMKDSINQQIVKGLLADFRAAHPDLQGFFDGGVVPTKELAPFDIVARDYFMSGDTDTDVFPTLAVRREPTFDPPLVFSYNFEQPPAIAEINDRLKRVIHEAMERDIFGAMYFGTTSHLANRYRK